MYCKVTYYISKFLKKARLAAVKNSTIHTTSKIESGSHVSSAVFGKYSYCGYNCEILNCIIGNYVSIANNCRIGGANHVVEWASTSPVFYYGRDSIKKKFSEHKRPPGKKTVVGSDVWIGDGCLIKAGVTIGVGSVVGMGSVVTHDVKPYSIVAGNPAKIIKYRFDNETIELLLNSRWWELSDDIIGKCAEYICDPIVFLKKINDIKK